MNAMRFVVEHAGCETCAQRVRSALAPLIEIESITIDEAADTAVVVARTHMPPSPDDIDSALAAASAGSGHTYHLKPNSLT